MRISTKRIIIYLIGMFILAAGLTLNTKTTLGVSPILSVPYSVSQIFSLNFADLVFVWYCFFVVLQLFIHFFFLHEKDKAVYLSDVLQIVISLIFTRIMNVISLWIPVFESECSGFFGSLCFRFLMLALAILLTGIGAASILNMKLIPNPGDGIVAAIASVLKRPVGTCKNIVDITCVLITLILCLVFSDQIYGIGIGTLCAMLGVGRVINFINREIDFSKYLL